MAFHGSPQGTVVFPASCPYGSVQPCQDPPFFPSSVPALFLVPLLPQPCWNSNSPVLAELCSPERMLSGKLGCCRWEVNPTPRSAAQGNYWKWQEWQEEREGRIPTLGSRTAEKEQWELGSPRVRLHHSGQSQSLDQGLSHLTPSAPFPPIIHPSPLASKVPKPAPKSYLRTSHDRGSFQDAPSSSLGFQFQSACSLGLP